VAEVAGWAAGLEEVHERIASRFSRSEPRERVVAYLRGLLGPLERKNGWALAELAGESSPGGMQRLLATADWSPDRVCEPAGVLPERTQAPHQRAPLDPDRGFQLDRGTTQAAGWTAPNGQR